MLGYLTYFINLRIKITKTPRYSRRTDPEALQHKATLILYFVFFLPIAIFSMSARVLFGSSLKNKAVDNLYVFWQRVKPFLQYFFCMNLSKIMFEV